MDSQHSHKKSPQSLWELNIRMGGIKDLRREYNAQREERGVVRSSYGNALIISGRRSVSQREKKEKKG